MNSDSSQWPCPSCGTQISGTEASSRRGFGESSAPWVQHVVCPGCDVLLERNLDGQDTTWRVDDRSQAPDVLERNLREIAAREGLEFKFEEATGFWRCILFEPGSQRTQSELRKVSAGGKTRYIAMKQALVAAEELGLY